MVKVKVFQQPTREKPTLDCKRRSMSVVMNQSLGLDLQPALRLVLVGQERVGKSSVGNTILGKTVFDNNFSMRPLSVRSQMSEANVLGRMVSVVDTPGLLSSLLSEEQVKAEMERALELSHPGPHAFLLTIQLGRFTEQEQLGMKLLQKILDSGVRKHTIVLFTYGDRLRNMNIEEFIQGDQNLLQLINKCSGQYQLFNNMEEENGDQVKELLRKVDDVSQGGCSFYQKSSDLERLVVQVKGMVCGCLNWSDKNKIKLLIGSFICYATRWLHGWFRQNEE